MSQVFECPSCDTLLKARPEMAGRTLKCPGCQEPISVSRTAFNDGASVPMRADGRSVAKSRKPGQFLLTHWMWVAGATPLILAALLAFADGPERLQQTASHSSPNVSDVTTVGETAASVSRAPRAPRASAAVESDVGGSSSTFDTDERMPLVENASGSGRPSSVESHPVIAMEGDLAPPQRAGNGEVVETIATTPARNQSVATDVAPTRKAIPAEPLMARSGETASWPALRRLTNGVRWSHPQLSDRNYLEWSRFIRPTANDLEWQKVRWHTELAVAAEEASRLQRPILLWTMNGHPCGET